jgi:hypothetical protein
VTASRRGLRSAIVAGRRRVVVGWLGPSIVVAGRLGSTIVAGRCAVTSAVIGRGSRVVGGTLVVAAICVSTGTLWKVVALAISSKVLGVVGRAATVTHSTSKVRVVPTEDVLAMTRRHHPLAHALFFTVVAISNVLGDRAPVETRAFHTISGLRSVGAVMGHGTHAGLILRVLLSRALETLVEAEWAEAIVPAFLVDKAEHFDRIVRASGINEGNRGECQGSKKSSGVHCR